MNILVMKITGMVHYTIFFRCVTGIRKTLRFFLDTLFEMDNLLFSVNQPSVDSSTKRVTIPCFSPTHIKGWTSEETTTLFRLLQFMKRGDWIRYEAKTFHPVEHRALELTFNRDLGSTPVHRTTLDLIQDVLSDFESDLRDSLNAQVFTFQDHTFHQDIPNHFCCEQFFFVGFPEFYDFAYSS